MHKILLIALAVISFAACTNSSSGKKETNENTAKTVAIPVDTTKKIATGKETNTTSYIKEILASYLQMKNAFVNDNSKDAAAAGNEMGKSFSNFNKASLSPQQAKIYDDITDDAKEHAEHIGSNGGNIKHQREHFEMLSKDIYQLVKTFGSGQKLYYDHCPMYNNGKGADWISETNEIANPYFGKSMPTCGKIKEELK